MYIIVLYLFFFSFLLAQGQPPFVVPGQEGTIPLFNQQPGSNTGGNRPIRYQDLDSIDWTKVDRRDEEQWYHLYGFGEKFYDADVADQPWNDKQIDLDFFFPYYGFRLNYTFIYPEGFIAFSSVYYIQPPYTFPEPQWPDKPDTSLIAAFLSPQTFMAVGDHRISHVWYRIISRPPNLIGKKGRIRPDGVRREGQFQAGSFGEGSPLRYYNNQLLKTQEGRIEDPEFLDELSEDIKRGMIGARGFTADYALVVTWERMAYGGSPKSTHLNEYESVKRWQNTYQMVIATDEIRSYTMFNYANINWTSSTSAGSLSGRGGKQSAIVGFNGGNGTGFVQLPYSAEGNSYKLVQFGSTPTAGRWQARVDEKIKYGGCINTSTGSLITHTGEIPMQGGFSLNVSGPCFRSSNVIKMQIDELTIDCTRIDMVVAQCVIPINAMWRTGYTDAKISVDGGKNYPFWRKVYILQPGRGARQGVKLLNDPLYAHNNWYDPMAENLTVRWSSVNITNNPNARVDITLWGYWEDVEGHDLMEIGAIAKEVDNKGRYTFNPRQLGNQFREYAVADAWKRFHGGMIQVRVSNNWLADTGDGLYWSTQIPFGWYFHDKWEEEYGSNWPLDMCLEWFEYDGQRNNFIMELAPKLSCPCTLDQARADFGRFTAKWDCNEIGNAYCYYTQGAAHCVLSTVAVATGGAQMCCYDPEGWLMFSDDYEYNNQYLRFYSAGVPYRAHPWGAHPYKRPPYVPTMSNFYNDLLPFEYCCKWAEHCEFYFWRRQTSGCQDYRPPRMGFAYGEGHFITYDNLQYSFSGKGYFTLTEMKSPYHDLKIQVRMEQPPKTIWNQYVRATVITGVTMKDNGSDTVEIYARKQFTRWRYRLNAYISGRRRFTDKNAKKITIFNGGVLLSPARNYDMSVLEVLFTTGVGVRVMENRGLLDIEIVLPPNYNETRAHPYDDAGPLTGQDKCSGYYRTVGLLGTWNNDKSDDLMAPDCAVTQADYPQSPDQLSQIYRNFGEKWRVDRGIMFSGNQKPLYYPLEFASPDYLPDFDPWRDNNASFARSLIFTKEEVEVTCQGVPACVFDYVTSGVREKGLDTLRVEKNYKKLKSKGEDVSRSLEMGLKWMTGILSTIGIIAIIAVIFLCCFYRRIKMQKSVGKHRRPVAPKMAAAEAYREPYRSPASYEPEQQNAPPPINYNVPIMENEPGSRRFAETAY